MKLFSPAWCPTQRKWMHESDSKQNKTPLFYHSLGHMDFIFSCIFHLFGLPAAILGLPARFLSHCWGYSSLNAVGQQLHSSISELKNHVNVEKIDLQRKCSLTHQKPTIVIQDGVHPSLHNLDQIRFINVSDNFSLNKLHKRHFTRLLGDFPVLCVLVLKKNTGNNFWNPLSPLP